ncbi:MAG: cytochrome c [Lysobacterales bacterium]|nr:MAG: cytochrome c [Xanthomonadales bacterium]
MNSTRNRLFPTVAATLLVTACGGGGGGGDSSAGPVIPPAPPPTASSKTVIASGAITGFGSVIVNGVRYDTSATTVFMDDQPGSLDDLRVGHVIRVEAEVDDRGQARARRIDDHPLLRGRIEAIDAPAGTVTVAGQVVHVGDDTSFDDSIVGGALDGLAVGERLEVHGYAGSSGQARATRIEKDDAAELEIETTGVVADLDTAARRFSVGRLRIDYSTAVLEDFGAAGVQAGDLVEVKGRTLLADGTLRAERVQKEDDRFGSSDDEAEVEGLVTRFASATDFDVAGRRATTTAATVYVGGASTDLRLDVKVEVEGRVDDSGTLVATKVVFKRQSTVRLAAPVESVDAAAGTFVALGLTIVVDVNTRREDQSDDDDASFSLEDLRVGDWVEVRGQPDPSVAGRVIAARLERDEPEDEVELRGPATAVEAPRFRILGVAIETTPATEFEDDELGIGAGTFFAAAAGRIVDVEGQWNGSSLLADKAEIEREDGGIVVTPPPVNPPPPSEPPPVNPPPPPPAGPDGAALYAADCAGCHGAITAIRSMPVSNRAVSDIQRAITENKGGMGFLSRLTTAELQAISDAMRAANP